MECFGSVDIYLQPGDYHFADRGTRIRTVLGSCVSMTFWHPKLLVGGMCHYLLPKRGNEYRAGEWPAPNGHYADEAMALLMSKMDGVGASHKEYQVKLIGGGNMFPGTNKNMASQVGILNVQAARQLTKQYGFPLIAEHLGGIGYRSVVFEVQSGGVWIKHCDMLSQMSINESTGVQR